MADPTDPGLSIDASEVVQARLLSNLHWPCPLCGAENPLPEVFDPGTVRHAGVEHEAGCPVSDDEFRVQVLAPFAERYGRLPRQVAIVCELDTDFILKPIELAA